MLSIATDDELDSVDALLRETALNAQLLALEEELAEQERADARAEEENQVCPAI